MKKSITRSLSTAILTCILASSLISSESAFRPDVQNTEHNKNSDTLLTDTTIIETAPQSETEESVPTDTAKTELIFEDDATETYDTLFSYMKQYPSLELFNTGSTVLTAEEYVSLCEVNPAVTVISKVQFEGTVLDLSLNEIDISEKIIADKEDFDALLSHFPAGIKLVMCDCGYTDEEMGALRDKHAKLDFTWRIYMGKWSLRTDDEAFSVMIYDDNYVRLTSEDIEVLRYCTNMYALDLGHQAITDLSVIGEMTDLRVLILADNKITDLTPLSSLKNLQYLELFVNRISDLSPLAKCTNLVDLNFGWNSIYDLSSIYSLEKIERLWLPTTRVSSDKRAEITENFPNAQIVFEDVNSISSGWRTHERYFSMRGMFNNNKYDPNFVKNKDGE